jgi:hypothetical protein
MEPSEIAATIDTTMQGFNRLFASFTDEQVNTVPFEGSWTPGQLGKHISMSGRGFSQLVRGPVKDSPRPADEMVEQIRATFLDFNHKMKSPGFVSPPLADYNRGELLNELEEIRNSLGSAATELDLEKTCTAFELPVLGMLTRLEAIYFVNYHTLRHTRQLQGIYDKLAGIV